MVARRLRPAPGLPGFGGRDIRRASAAPIADVPGLRCCPLLDNELAAAGTPVVLVLDDYQVIKDRRCHEQIEFLLLHLPASAQIVIITRADPPLPLSRLRAAGEMTEIRRASSALHA